MSSLIHSLVRALLLLALPTLTWAQSIYSLPYSFTTLAGSSSIGSTDGSGTAARFYGPEGMAVDVAGNVFLVDSGNNTIRKITPAGAVTTFAGKAGIAGSADGVGAAARFYNPGGMVADAAGNYFVSDTGNHVIRRITAAGEVTTFAGTAGMAGSADGQGAAARFKVPGDLAIDAAGNLYLTDMGNYTVRKITPAGVVTTLAGSAGVSGTEDGNGSSAHFVSPYGLAVDATGNVFLFDLGTSPTSSYSVFHLRKITPAGAVSRISSYFIMRETVMDSPAGLTFDAAGNRIETQGGQIHKVTPGGTKTTLAGSTVRGYADGPVASATFGAPGHVVYDGQGNLYVSDGGNNNVRKITPAGTVSTVAGLALPSTVGSTDAAGGAARFNRPTGVAVGANGVVYVADALNYTIRRISPAGEVTTLAGMPGQSGTADGTGSIARFLSPAGVAVDAANNVYVAEVNGALRKITPAGVVTTLWQFESPQGVAVNGAGWVYVADNYAHAIYKISPEGTVSVYAGAKDQQGYVDGVGGSARFHYPRGLALDSVGNVYVSEPNDNLIRKITPDGNVTTLAGSPSSGSADGTGVASSFFQPNYLAVDGSGNIFVTDTNNQTIRRITPEGAVTTVAGLLDSPGSTDGAGSEARFYYPLGIAASATGEVYVTSGETIRRGQPAGRPVITAQPQNVSVTAGAAAQFSVTATADPAPTYQWYFNGNAISAATASTYSLAAAQSANAGDYTVVVTNSLGSVTSTKATLTVNAVVTPPPSSGGGGGGGGGAPSMWFLAALAAAWVVRRRLQSCTT